jgi:hypothetical protein
MRRVILTVLFICSGPYLSAPFTSLFVSEADEQTSGKITQTAVKSAAASGVPSVVRGYAGFVTPEAYGGYGDGKHDDTAAIRACLIDSGTKELVCRLVPVSGVYLMTQELFIPNGAHAEGTSSSSSSATVLRSEYNGDAIGIDPGPIQGVTFKDLNIVLNPQLPNQRGFHAQARYSSAFPTQGGFWNSHFFNVAFNYCPLECIWLDGRDDGSLPNQFLDFHQVAMNGPAQPHPAALLLLTGQTGQIAFTDVSSVGGDAPFSRNYPHALVELRPCSRCTPNTVGSPTNVTFEGMNIGNGTTAMDNQFTHDISFEHGWIENVLTPFTISDVHALTIRANHIANSGSVVGILTTTPGSCCNENVSLLNNEIIWSNITPAILADCSAGGSFTIDGNTQNPLLTTKGCNTTQLSPSATLTLVSNTVLINGDGGRTPIQTINAPITASRMITLLASPNSGFSLGAAGNINLGNNPAPLIVPAGTNVTLQGFDLGGGTHWVVTGMFGFPLSIIASPKR